MHDRRSTTAAHMPWLLPLAALATIGATPAGERDAGAVPLPFGRARPAAPFGSRWRLVRPSARETAAVAGAGAE